MEAKTNEAPERGREVARSEEDRFLSDLARKNLELEARYAGEESLGQNRPLSLWERIRQAISVLASTGPTR